MSKKTINVVHLPDWSDKNPYQSLLVTNLSMEVDGCRFENYPDGLFPFNSLLRKQHSTQIIHMHWITPFAHRLIWSRNDFVFWLKLACLVGDVLIARLKGIKLVWTIHNKVSHQEYDAKREIAIRRWLARVVNRVIVHSEPALKAVSQLYGYELKQKATVINHGNYRNVYPSPSLPSSIQELRAELSIEKSDTVILFFGVVRPYKGIEQLISAVNNTLRSDLKVLIVGNCPDKQYAEKIKSLLNGSKSIFTKFEYIADQELIDFIEISDVVALPFSDTLTSGSVILAMTQGKALILPEAAKVLGVVPDSGVFYYENSSALENLISVDHSKSVFKQMGRDNIAVAEKLTWEKVADLTLQLYRQLTDSR